MFNQVCKVVLPYLMEEYGEEVETKTTKVITRFCYYKVGIDNLYEEHSAIIGSGNFRDTLGEEHLRAILEEELRISRKLIALPYTLTSKISRPADLLNYIA